jgi:hypothetical protein
MTLGFEDRQSDFGEPRFRRREQEVEDLRIVTEPEALHNHPDQHAFANQQKSEYEPPAARVSFRISATICFATRLCNSVAASASRRGFSVISYPSSLVETGYYARSAPCLLERYRNPPQGIIDRLAKRHNAVPLYR